MLVSKNLIIKLIKETIEEEKLKQVIKKIIIQETQTETFYVAGGKYPEGDNYVFKLVSPTNGLPYVSTSMRGLDLTSHHANLYKLSSDYKTAILLQSRGDVSAPKTAKLREKDYKGVLERIQKKSFLE